MAGGGVTALWIGGSTAFVEPASGRLLGLQACSRLVDDGERLWCNNPAGTTAFGYDLAELFPVEQGVRLMFPERDPQATTDVTHPVFMDGQGRAVAVDAASGLVKGTLAPTQTGEAFGMTTYPSSWTVGELSFVTDGASLYLIDPAAGRLVWRTTNLRPSGIDALTRLDGELWSLGWTNHRLDLATGQITTSVRRKEGIYSDVVAGRLTAVGLEELGVIRLP